MENIPFDEFFSLLKAAAFIVVGIAFIVTGIVIVFGG